MRCSIRLYVSDPTTALEASKELELSQVPRVGESLYVNDSGPFEVKDVSWHLPDGVFIVARTRLNSAAYPKYFGETRADLVEAGWDVTVRP